MSNHFNWCRENSHEVKKNAKSSEDENSMKETSKQTAWKIFVEYVDITSIHGVRYVGEKDRPWIERVWWLVILIVSGYLCGVLILDTYIKWNDEPVIVSFASRYSSVGEIPFPAVTICSETKAVRSLFNMTELNEKMETMPFPFDLTETEMSELATMMKVCNQVDIDWRLENKTVSEDVTIGILRKLSPKFEDLVVSCGFGDQQNEADSCRKMFTEIIIEDGVCYTFNMLNASEIYRSVAIHRKYAFPKHDFVSEHWNMEDGYDVDATWEEYPNRILGAGTTRGLNVFLSLFEHDYDYKCRAPVQGFKVALHSPVEIPHTSKQFFRVPPNQEVVISVKPQVTLTSDDLRPYSPEKRQCYFNGERNLKFFKVYTQKNCELECLTNVTLASCKCVQFHQPREAKTPLCGLPNKECADHAELLLMTNDLESLPIEPKQYMDNCKCLPACFSISYDAEISQAEINYSKYSQATLIPQDTRKEYSRLVVSFKETQFMSTKRAELYGQTDFIANCGGLLGLFMGISFLSFAELIYYFTIRLFSNLYQQKQNYNVESDIGKVTMVREFEVDDRKY